eukprot:scaffold238285_cov31-Attheya_sp.AAC.2
MGFVNTQSDPNFPERETSDRGVIYCPDKSKGLECYVDADFAGGWNLADADSAENVLSRMGFVIMYAGCLVLWVSKLPIGTIESMRALIELS